jgi:hypothetical protein
MSLFRTVSVFELPEGNVYEQMCKSASYIQAIYCFPVPSEYFVSLENKVNQNSSYLEQHIYFHSEEKYKEWYGIFGEILEELMEEIHEDFLSYGIVYRRFFDDVEVSGAARAESLSEFRTKFNENNEYIDLP